MAHLPAVDLGLMADHLSAHEGVIHKLKAYQEIVTNHQLRDIIRLQENVMRTHVWVMLALINPEYSHYVEVPPLSNGSTKHSFNSEKNEISHNNKWIVLELRNTAKNMSSTNYNSALMMQNTNVINAHIEMALQQHQLQKKYDEFITHMRWQFVPRVSVEEQVNTFLHFQHLL
ncbi:hypothetical protein SAMN05421676_107168 [Salinibacillus kushneri]|uniref:Coat F domain-containing protein n=1 Tax=Salinibacillus kushneri TaxID=237682 RepID=A0A1I0GW55_9BACI|nr:hypothetical protein [Salinibacillus kushneri]SET74750.1 hypothetical protein SAMN05421676_107168 [Salinibacillus kushneri]